MKIKPAIITLVATIALLFSIEIIFNIFDFNNDVHLTSELNSLSLETVNWSFFNKYFSTPIDNSGYVFKREIWNPQTSRVGVVLGESTSQGYPYLNNVDFPNFLEMALRHSTGENYQIVNLSQSAQSSYTVRDLVSTIDVLKPEFILVYSGHNEYYGTISRSSFQNGFQRELFLLLNKISVMRFIFSMFKDPLDEDISLMDFQFNRNRYGLVDSDIADVVEPFINNIDAVTSYANNRAIPIILVEPVSNLIDQPPFLTSASDELISRWKDWNNALQSKDLETIKANVDWALSSPLIAYLATTQYLLGQSLLVVESKVNLQFFVNAKDRDEVPFRARTQMIERYREWAKEKMNNNYNISFIQLNQDLFSKYGAGFFGFPFFVDHVHLSFDGHLALAQTIFPRLARTLSLSSEQINSGVEYLINPEKLRSVLPFHSIFAENAQVRLVSIFLNQPFSSMFIPIQVERVNAYPIGWPRDPLVVSSFVNAITSGLDPLLNSMIIISKRFEDSGRPDLSYEIFRSFAVSYPGYPLSWLYISQWHKKFGSDVLAAKYLSFAHELALGLELKNEIEIINQFKEQGEIEYLDMKNNDSLINDILNLPSFPDLLLEIGVPVDN